MAKKSNLRERLAKKRQDIKDKSKGFQYLMAKEGTTRYRILPVGEEEDFSIEATCFYLGKELGLVISPHTFGEKCALMNAHNELSNSKSESDREAGKRLRPSKKFFMPAVVYKDEKGKEIDMATGPKLLMLAPGVTSELIELFLDEDEAGDFTDPKNGYDIKVTRTGKGKMDTEYTVRACKPTPLTNKSLTKTPFKPEEMLRAIMPDFKGTKDKLEQFLNLPPEEDDDAPKKKSDKPLKKKKKNRDL